MSAFFSFPLSRQIDLLTAKGKVLADEIYPPRCMICREPTESASYLCGSCWADTSFISGAVCNSCGTPLPGDAGPDLYCDGCIENLPAWDKGRAAVLYEGAGRRAILALKHGDRLDIAKPLAGWLAHAAGDLIENTDVIVPVPLHWRRLFRRRYNQSAELARHLGKQVDVDIAPNMLLRKKATRIQKGMSRLERLNNQSAAFALHPRHSPAGKRVLLVDDVMTTGATLSACTEVLRQAGAEQIDALVLARVAQEI